MYHKLTVKADVEFDTMCEAVVEEMGEVYSNRWEMEGDTVQFHGWIIFQEILILPNLEFCKSLSY